MYVIECLGEIQYCWVNFEPQYFEEIEDPVW